MELDFIGLKTYLGIVHIYIFAFMLHDYQFGFNRAQSIDTKYVLTSVTALLLGDATDCWKL